MIIRYNNTYFGWNDECKLSEIDGGGSDQIYRMILIEGQIYMKLMGEIKPYDEIRPGSQ